MNRKVSLTIITILIVLLSALACIIAIIPEEGDSYTVVSGWGEEVEMQGRGLYARDSRSMAVQAIAQDWITLLMGIPLLTVALVSACRGSYRGKLLFCGAMGYFLYTYASYSFLVSYNGLFLVYVALFSLSLFGFIFSFLEINIQDIRNQVKTGFPRKSLSIFFLLMALMLLSMWLGRILPSIGSGVPPYGLETYTTLVIQALDLGVIVPLAAYTAIALFRRKDIGYALAIVVVFKGMMLFSAVSMMALLMKLDGIDVSPVELAFFPGATLVNFLFALLILRNFRTAKKQPLPTENGR